MTAGFYSPMPPARTGVADYAAALLDELRRRGRVELAPGQCDVALYHLGNNPLHQETYRRALENPGVVALHDATLHHFLLGRLDEQRYIEEFAYNYGEWNRPLAREMWAGRAAAAADSRYFERPMLRRAVERAKAVVVHNPEAARIAREHGAVRVVEIPHFYQPPAPQPTDAEALRFRERLGLEPGTMLFGVFGYLRESKRLMPVLQVFEELRREQPRLALLVAGDFVSADLERAAAPMLVLPGVIRAPYLADADFWAAAAAVDACINLRDPSAGETSGITIRLMGMGKPVLVTDSPATAGFPVDACIRVERGIAERESLRQNLLLLTLISGAAEAIGGRAAAYIRENHSLGRAGDLYWNLLCECCS